MVGYDTSFRESFSVALWHKAKIQVVGEASSARDAVPTIERTHPDLVLVDFALKDSDGISFIRDLRRRRIQTRTMVFSAHTAPASVREAFAAGAAGYASKEDSLAELVAGMQICLTARYLSASLGEIPAATDDSQEGIDALSNREREVFLRIIQGASGQAMAESLCISLKTVETHRLHINRKLGTRGAADLIRLAAAKGLLLS